MTSIGKHSRFSNVSLWVCCIGCIASLKPWFVWQSPHSVTIIMSIFVCLRALMVKPRYSCAIVISVLGIAFFAGIYLQLFIIPIKKSLYETINLIIPLLFFSILESHEKTIFLERTVNVFSFILFLSLFFFLLHFYIDLPYTIIQSNSDFYPPFKNYLFFVVAGNNDLEWFTRFNSIYTEPGHVGTLCAILLYINGFSLKKWQNIIMTIALIWSFSLAGYVLYVIGILLYMLCVSKNVVFTSAKILGIGLILIICGMAFYSPSNDDIFSVKILSRLEYSDTEGISGNNRHTLTFEQFYEELMQSDQKYFGIGRVELARRFGETGNSSYKNYLVGNGYIGLLNLLFLGLILLYSYPSRKGLGLMLLFSISFIQRPFFLWHIQVFSYVAALGMYTADPIANHHRK